MRDYRETSPTEKLAVLIADGDDDNARYVERQLRHSGVCNPIVTFNTGAGLEAYLQQAIAGTQPKPCVLFLDPRLPGGAGFEPVRLINREPALEGTKVVIFSATNHPEEIESAGELGVHLFLKKHPQLSSLTMIVSHLCGARGDEKQPWAKVESSSR